MSKLSTRTRKFILSMEGGAQGAHVLSHRNPDNIPLQGDIVIPLARSRAARQHTFPHFPMSDLNNAEVAELMYD